MRVWRVVVVGLLLLSLVLGFQATRGAVNPDLHATGALVVTAMAVANHVRQGSGWDFLAVLLLLGAVALGFGARDGNVGRDFHLSLALSAVALSVALHLRR